MIHKLRLTRLGRWLVAGFLAWAGWVEWSSLESRAQEVVGSVGLNTISIQRQKLSAELKKKISENNERAMAVSPDKRVEQATRVAGTVVLPPAALAVFQREDNKDILLVPGFPTDLNAGLPEIPSAIVQLKVPKGRKYKALKHTTQWVDVIEPLDLPLAPEPGYIQPPDNDMPYKRHVRSDTPPLRPESRTNAFYPRAAVEVVHVGTHKGRQIVGLRISAVQYNPVSKKLRFHYKIDYELQYE